MSDTRDALFTPEELKDIGWVSGSQGGPPWGISFMVAEFSDDETGVLSMTPRVARQLAGHLNALADEYDVSMASAVRDCPTCQRKMNTMISPDRKRLLWGCRYCEPHALSWGDEVLPTTVMEPAR